MKHAIVIILFSLSLIACSDDKTDKVEQHVWQDQTDMIGKAKELEGLVLEQAEQQRHLIEQKTQ